MAKATHTLKGVVSGIERSTIEEQHPGEAQKGSRWAKVSVLIGSPDDPYYATIALHPDDSYAYRLGQRVTLTFEE